MCAWRHASGPWRRWCRRVNTKRRPKPLRHGESSGPSEEKERRAQKRHERTALMLAQAMPLEKGDRFEFRTGNGWEALRVLEVSAAISHRPNFGEIKVYKCESVATSKIYPQIDLSSWRGAEGACQVRKVKRAAPPPPPTPTPAEMAEQKGSSGGCASCVASDA